MISSVKETSPIKNVEDYGSSRRDYEDDSQNDEIPYSILKKALDETHDDEMQSPQKKE